MEDVTPPNDDAAEAARAEAEARRQRILNRSSRRLDMVSGEAPPEEGGEETAAAADRMQQMRRRRFKKGKKQTEKSDEKADSNENQSSTAEAAAGDVPATETPGAGDTQSADIPNSDSPASDTEADATTKVLEEPEASKNNDTDRSKADEPTVPVAADNPTDDQPTKAKYRGITAVRRRKLLEKKQKAVEAADTKPDTPKPQRKSAQVVVALPIIMHILTVLLLFLAGLDIGWQSSIKQQVLSPTVHRDLAPQRFFVKTISEPSEASPRELLEGMEWQNELEDGDEFEEEGSKTQNIDPLFGVDLDELTAGKPGITYQMARFAIQVHRTILKLFYYFPRRLFLGALVLPHRLWENPPVLCILALFLRQVIAQRILGANLPKHDDEVQEDLLVMLQQKAISFISNTFPTAVGAYQAWSHVRADMYVLLCGLFVGLSLWAPRVALLGVAPEEIPADVGPTEELHHVASDEL